MARARDLATNAGDPLRRNHEHQRSRTNAVPSSMAVDIARTPPGAPTHPPMRVEHDTQFAQELRVGAVAVRHFVLSDKLIHVVIGDGKSKVRLPASRRRVLTECCSPHIIPRRPWCGVRAGAGLATRLIYDTVLALALAIWL